MSLGYKIRNFVIISHVDHGKSTLADRLLEKTETILPKKMHDQYLDRMNLEQEKGITIKMHPVQMKYQFAGQSYILNLIDTPGHTDFAYEVSRALAAVEGAILLVDATQGIQAQTITNLKLAQQQNLIILPVINKIDSPQAQIEKAKKELAALLEIDRNSILEISAKEGWGIEEVLEQIILLFPSPKERGQSDPFRCLIFDSQYDSFQGVIAYVRIIGGKVKAGDKIYLLAAQREAEVKEVGYFKPDRQLCAELVAGEIGYLATGIKDPEIVNVGETIILESQLEFSLPQPLPGYHEPLSVVFSSLYVSGDQDFNLLKSSLEKLKLSDPSLTFIPEKREGLGRGFRCGFLGLLHTEITVRRLEEEFGLDLVITFPMVNYSLRLANGEEVKVNSAADWPAQGDIKNIEEPWVELAIVTKADYLGKVMQLLSTLEGSFRRQDYLQEKTYLLTYRVPLREIISGFDDQLKSITQGHASFGFHFTGYCPGDLTKLEVFVAKEKEESLSRIVSRRRAYREAQKMADKLYELLPSQQFAVPIQVQSEGRVIVRRTIKARGKNVTQSLYGGDYTRKKKLLVKQRKGKKKLGKTGKVKIPSKIFFQMLESKN